MTETSSGIDWHRQIDGYCERLEPGLWAEPVNLVTNALFVLVGVIAWQRSAPLAARGLYSGQVLAVILCIIGIGSALFHSFATRWASAADVLPIGIFVLSYIYVSNRDFAGLGKYWAIPATLIGFALLWPLASGIRMIWPQAGGNALYGAVCLLIFLYAVALIPVLPRTGGRLLAGALILALSITARALDLPLCEDWPLGTHFLWHVLNAVMLGWMIETWRRNRLETLCAA